MPLQLLWSAAARVGSHFFDVFASDTKDLTERRGFVEMSLAGRTDTPTTEDPRGTPERGSISISIATWMLDTRNKCFVGVHYRRSPPDGYSARVKSRSITENPRLLTLEQQDLH
jgi:hypothetical protein